MAGMDNIAEKVRRIVADLLEKPIDQVKLESRFVKDLGAESIDTVELVIALEDAFGFEISDEEAEQMHKVGDVVKFLQKYLPKSQIQQTGNRPMEEKDKKEVKRIKLLCVDDETEVTEFLSDYFNDKGYESYTADTGEKALELLRKYNPNIVLLDIRLSNSEMRDGIRVLQEIKKYNPAIKVIMVTAVLDQPVIDKAKESGASDYITKPLSLEYLDTVVMEKIQEILSSKSDLENKQS